MNKGLINGGIRYCEVKMIRNKERQLLREVQNNLNTTLKVIGKLSGKRVELTFSGEDAIEKFERSELRDKLTDVQVFS